MKIYYYPVLTAMLLCIVLSCNITSKKNQKFYNPVLAGYYPDPSICRVDDNYYLVNSSFAHYPGVPIFQSKDLVNWKQIGHVLDRPEQLDLDNLGVSRGIFAPAIRYYHGVFYITTTLVEKGGNFVVTAKNPAGPWSNPVWLPDVLGIDPSLFFDDDGKAYIIYNSDPPNDPPLYNGHRALWMYEFDTNELKTVGEKYLIVNGGTDISKKPIWIEGPHIYKINGYYYLLAAEGGTSFMHSEVVFRSKNVTGPYESYQNNPILTQRHLDAKRKNPITCVGHADIVETPKGEWWAVFLGCRPYETYFFNTGRETFMAPVRWIDEWPVINPDFDTLQFSYPAPDLPSHPYDSFPLNGNFTLKEDFNTSQLPYYWIFLRTVRENWYSLDENPGNLRIQCRPYLLSERANPSFIARRQQHLNFTASAAMNFSPKSDNETAGIVAFQNERNYYYLGKTLVEDKLFIRLERGQDLMKEIELDKDMIDKTLYLKITGEGHEYHFYYAVEPDKWIPVMEKVDGYFLSTEVAGGFVGTVLGMYASSQGKSSTNYADFDWFEYSGNDSTF